MNKVESAVFVYESNDTGEIRVRYAEDAKALDKDKSWNHIGTLEPAAYINRLLREYPALVRELKK